jgi:hypothetical protein
MFLASTILVSSFVGTRDITFVLSKIFMFFFKFGAPQKKTQPLAVGRVVFYAVRVILKESKRLFVARTLFR